VSTQLRIHIVVL